MEELTIRQEIEFAIKKGVVVSSKTFLLI